MYKVRCRAPSKLSTNISGPKHQTESGLSLDMGSEFLLPRAGTIEDPVRLAVLVSGGGSGLAALLRYQQTPRSHSTVLALADSTDAEGLEHARNAGVKSVGVPLPMEIDRSERRLAHEHLVHAELVAADVELVVLSGYMRILTPWFVSRWKGRLINIHPSLLPNFPGAHAHRDVLAAGVSVTGCSVHLVDEGVASGPVLAQSQVEVLPDDDGAALQARLKKIEHILYPEILDQLCSGRISL